MNNNGQTTFWHRYQNFLSIYRSRARLFGFIDHTSGSPTWRFPSLGNNESNFVVITELVASKKGLRVLFKYLKIWKSLGSSRISWLKVVVEHFSFTNFIDMPQPFSDHGIAQRIGSINLTNLSRNIIYFGVSFKNGRDDHLGYSF